MFRTAANRKKAFYLYISNTSPGPRLSSYGLFISSTDTGPTSSGASSSGDNAAAAWHAGCPFRPPITQQQQLTASLAAGDRGSTISSTASTATTTSNARSSSSSDSYLLSSVLSSGGKGEPRAIGEAAGKMLLVGEVRQSPSE